MTIAFRYKNVNRPDGSAVKTPSIPIRLDGTERFETLGLLDSGADITAMPKSIADILGIDLTGKTSTAHGVGGKVDAIDTTTTITVEKGHEKYKFEMPVKVILGEYNFPILSGRAGFFDKFVISFDQSNERISLKRAQQGNE